MRGVDLNHRPLGYEPNELPDCSTPHFDHNQWSRHRQTSVFFQPALTLPIPHFVRGSTDWRIQALNPCIEQTLKFSSTKNLRLPFREENIIYG